MSIVKNNKPFTPKQVGERIKERRTELNLSMPELGRRVSVNKSTIQRYEADGVDPKRTMIINGLAQALLTTPEWLTGLSDEKEYSNYTVCQMSLEKHVKAYLETVTSAVDGAETGNADNLPRSDYRPLRYPDKILCPLNGEGQSGCSGRGLEGINQKIRYQYRLYHRAGLSKGNANAR